VSPYFAHQPATATLFGVTVGVWVVLELRQSVRRRANATVRDHGSLYVLRICAAAAWITMTISERWPAVAIGGQPATLALGLVLALGRYFTFTVHTSGDQPVIDSGPYRWLRHPSYSGLELISIGVALCYGNWPGLVAMITLPMIGLVNRIHVEEEALEAELGAAYRDFEATHKRMVPFVW
jgi:protein-S-isoprenylcysteine O-methyltransferase Ste14